MAKALHVCLIGYFSQLEKLDVKWRDLLSVIDKPVNSLINYSEQLQLVTSKEVDNAEICSVDGLREKLIFKINMGIEDEIALVLDVVSQLNNANQSLKNKLDTLESARDKVSLDDPSLQYLLDGSPLRPRLNLLLEFAIDGYKFYDQLYRNISTCMKTLDCKYPRSLENLSKSLIQNNQRRTTIDRILAFTQYLEQESIPN
ncbi:uncharacterized protein LOC107274901 [Cephus cinctus]|uniref:Uncharacterized protein LOC107274901 n=1 Tax=Cephus cinctus TaxID=211228 RepID=A0AAJ7VW77_CEPCN|nr:uncharacterized protein LOC107274901 [Cephus cinctus]XP_015609950.1 uncharacterized protein LOC107274901 [Cephus cinctus]XP_024935509.1 uncharacterized protein LOC107274901 [Cephus cinctus]XP_024935510.1 uncharacterized protein LOC107274901 [Cephus cinctus]